MAYAVDADLTTRIPATATATLAQRTLALADAQVLIDDQQYGARTLRLHCLLAAHYLVLAGAIVGGEGGIVSARSAGGISVSYAVTVPEGWDPSLTSTLYGRQFLQLAATMIPTMEVG